MNPSRENLHKANVHEALESAFASLSKREREVIKYYFFDGMGFKDIATRLKFSRDIVKRFYRKALFKLYRKIKRI